MGFAGVIIIGLLAGGAAFGFTTVTNVFGLPDLTEQSVPPLAKVEPSAPLDEPTLEKNAERIVEAPGGTKPSIDVLRAEPDGSFVVAGRAAPGMTVDLKDRAGATVASGTVDRTGDFVLLSERNLPSGDHELRLHASDGNMGNVSEEAAIVSIPEQDDAPVLAAVIAEEETVSVVDTPTSPPVALQNGPSPAVAIEAVEVEGGQLAIAGAAETGATVQVYLNNEPIGRATGTRDGRFLLETTTNLPPGRHDVRADVVERADGTVLARAAVPVLHRTTEQVAEAQVLQTGTSVIIRGGDSLWRISRKTYGQGIRYTTIFAANRDQIRDPDRIYIGQIFKLPDDAETSPN